MMNNAYAVIMAGGTGTRFWPHSKEAHPKQFLDILGTGKTLLQMTYDRFAAFIPEENIFISTNDRYESLVKEQLPKLTQDQLLLEPAKRNTAPCIAYACYKIASKNPDSPIIIAPSDHAIFNEASFQTSIQIACDAADNDKLITIGIQPNRPATGYGYIKFSKSEDDVKKVDSFTEKPSKEIAQEFIDSGEYVWNAGIFVWSGNAIRNAFRNNLTAMSELFENISKSFYKPEESDVIKREYLKSENVSIDYGILEKSKDVHVVLGDFDWSDLGSWASLHGYSEKDESGNVTRGEVMTYEVKNSLILGEEGKLIVVQGLNNHVIIDTKESLLVCEKDNEAVLKQAIADIKLKKLDKYL
jgi:mannose-1-phosphate guanylyltransferase